MGAQKRKNLLACTFIFSFKNKRTMVAFKHLKNVKGPGLAPPPTHTHPHFLCCYVPENYRLMYLLCSSYHFDLSTTNSVAAPKYDPWGPVNINGCSTSTLKQMAPGTLTDHNKLQPPNKTEYANLAGS